MSFMRLVASASLALALVTTAAQATPVTYTFAGDGDGSVGGTSFSGSFTFVFTSDTSLVDTSDAPFYRLFNVGGTFTQGATNVTLTPTAILVASSDLGLINFFNATANNGLGIGDPSLLGYDLLSSFGPLTAPDADGFLTPTFLGGAFASDGGPVSIVENTALTFTAVVREVSAVPEPLTLALFSTGLAGLAVVRRRRKAKA